MATETRPPWRILTARKKDVIYLWGKARNKTRKRREKKKEGVLNKK